MYDPNLIKEQAKRMQDMSEDDLKRASYSMPNMPGMPPGGLDPNMMKKASEMVGNMDEAQLKNMAEMAKNMGMAPGGMPNFNNPYANPNQAYQPSQSGSSMPKSTVKPEDDPFAKPEEQKQFDSVNEIKDKANKLFKENELNKASERYYEAINTIRTTKCLKDSRQGQTLEINCRLNLALCKIKQTEFDVAIDQCERVLLQDTENIKGLYRISVALHNKSKDLEAWSYIKRAYTQNPSDKAISELYGQIKVVKDKHDEERAKMKQQEEQKQAKTEPKVDQKQDQKQDDNDEEEDDRAKKLKSSFKFSSSDGAKTTAKTEAPKVQEVHEDVTIEEEEKKAPQPDPTQAQNTGTPYNRFGRPGGAMPDMSNISDDQLKMSMDMMKQNPEMFKNMMKSQGMDISDYQLNMMTNMMTPEMMRMAQNMQKQGMVPPNMQAPGAANTTGTAAPPPNPMAGGFPDMSGDQAEQMKKMSSEMFNNPEMLKSMMKMMNSDPNSPVMQMLQQQFPNVSPTTLSRVMGVMSYLVIAYANIKKVWSYTITKIIFFCICVYIVAWFLK